MADLTDIQRMIRAMKQGANEATGKIQSEMRQRARSFRMAGRERDRAARQARRNVRQSVRLQTRQFRAAARQQQRITRMTERATNQFNRQFQRVNNLASQVAPVSRVANNANNVPPHRTQASQMAQSRVLQRDTGQNVIPNRTQASGMQSAMRAEGLTPMMIAEIGGDAYHNMTGKQLGTTHDKVQYGKQYIGRGHDFLRNVRALTRRARSFNNTINRVKGTSVREKSYKGYQIKHSNLNDAYNQVRSQGNNLIHDYKLGISSELNKRSNAAQNLSSEGIHSAIDNDGNSYIQGNTRDTNTDLGKVNQMAHNGNQDAMQYLASDRAISIYTDSFGQKLRNVNEGMADLINNLQSMNSNFGNFTNGITPNEAQARFNPNATYLHYPAATPTGMIQNMGGTIGLATTGLFTSGSAIRNVNEQGNAVRQQMEPGVNALTLGRAINGASNVGHLDNHVADQLMREGRWNGQTSAQMSQYLGSLAGTRNTNATNQTQTAGDIARFSRNNNVNPTDTSQLFSTLANAGGLGNQNDQGNVVDFARQFAGMLHNDHLGSVSGQQAQGLNSIFGNMIGSGQTLTPDVVRNITAMQGALSSGPGGRVFQGQAGAQQLNSFSQGVGSQFSNMMVRNAFANTDPRYGGQQGLYRLQMDMQQPLKHPQQLAGMVQNLSSEGLGASGTEDELTQMGLSPDAAKKFYSEAMSGHLNAASLRSSANRAERQGGSTERHTNRQYRMQGNSTLDIKVAMNQQGQLHTSESMDAARRLGNRSNSLWTGHGFLNNVRVAGGAMAGTVGTAANFATLLGMLSGRNGNLSSRGLFNLGKHGGISGKLQRSKHPWLRKLGNLTSSSGSGIGTTNAQGGRYNNNYFYNNHFMGSSGTSNDNSNGSSSNDNSSNGSSNDTSSNSNEESSGNSSTDTDDDSYRDKRDSLEREGERARRSGDIGRERQIDQRIADLRRDHLNGGGLGDRFANWMSHGRTSRIPVNGRLVHGLNWLGHGSTGNVGRWIVSHAGRNYANTSGYRASEAPLVNRAVDSNLARRVNHVSTGIPTRMNLQMFADKSSALKTPSVMSRALSSGSKLASVGDHLKGPLAIASIAPQANDYLNHPTWSKTKNLGSNAVTGAADSISGPIGWSLTGAQALGGAMGKATGNKSYNALSRIANVGDDIFHPIKNGKGILSDMKSSWRFGKRHPWEALASSNPITGAGEVAYRHRHSLARFARHPFRSIGGGLHRLGGVVGRGWRGLKGFAGNALGGLRNTILGHGGVLALARNYLYLREINRLLPRLASKLAGLFGTNELSGSKGNSLNQSNVTNAVPQENAESVSKNNGNTSNTDNSNHDSHDTNNYFVGYPGHSGGASGILPSSLMDFFSHTHGAATS